MRSCDQCGVRLSESATECPVCGTNLGDEGKSSSSHAASAGPVERVAAVAAYFTCLPAIAFLCFRRYRKNPLVRFHAVQSILFHLLCAALAALLTFASIALVPGLGFLIVFPLYALAVFFIWCVLVLKAWQKELFQLPLLGDIALRQAAGSAI